MSKTVTGFRPPHCLAPVVGGGGYLVAGLFGVNRSFQTFPPNPDRSGKSAKTTPGRQRGNPRTVGSDSIEAAELSDFGSKRKGFLEASVSAPKRRRPSGRRLSSCRLAARQSILSVFFAGLRINRGLTIRNPLGNDREGKPPGRFFGDIDLGSGWSSSLRFSRACGSFERFVPHRPRARGGLLWAPLT